MKIKNIVFLVLSIFVFGHRTVAMKKRNDMQNIKDNKKEKDNSEEMVALLNAAMDDIMQTEKGQRLAKILSGNFHFEEENSSKLKKLLNLLKTILPCC